MTTEAQKQGHKHAEAFCLMEYRDTAGNREVIWNSRDGVTPFMLKSKQGFDSKHVNWQNDKYAPDHKPQPGDRIFVDMTEELAKPKAKEYVEKYWNQGMKETFTGKTKEEVAAKFVKDWTEKGSVTVVEIEPKSKGCIACAGVGPFEANDSGLDECQACGADLPKLHGGACN